mmetsp:Transcript_23660/g.37774  ORF Transcript_23660/g.37774 Transcript_23660/m.37774 type:complete len:94 (+) Transcript_23660:269-550(+)
MGEFAAPLRTLRLMHESIIAGLNNQQLTEQIKQFKEELDDILRDVAVMDMDHLRGYCTPLLYDDTKENLIEVLLKETEKKRIRKRATVAQRES